MPVYRPLEGEILTPGQFDIRSKRAEEESFEVDAVAGGPGPFRDFKPVDFGKPLNMVIRRIYTGKFPENICSAIASRC